MDTYTVEVLLSQDFRKTCFGDFDHANDPSVEFAHAAKFKVRADSPLGACEVAFAVCNSYPEEPHCSPEYLDVVRDYRAAGHRSLSVGDVVQMGVNGRVRGYACKRFGFEEF